MPTVNFRIYAPLSERLGLVKGMRRVVFDLAIEPGESLHDVFSRLAEKYPAFRGNLLEPETGRLVSHVSLLINGERLTSREAYDAPLQDSTEIVILPGYAGG